MKCMMIAGCLLLVQPAMAATQQDAEGTLAKAVSAEAEADRLGNRWVPTETALKAAQTALAAQKWNEAQDQAAEALALALRSIEQSHEQATAWRDAVVR